MKNAHERFGFAEFEKRLKDTTTRIRLTADCFIGEQPESAALPSATCFRSSAPTSRWRLSGLQFSARSRSRLADRIFFTSGQLWRTAQASIEGLSPCLDGAGLFDTWWWSPGVCVQKATQHGSSLRGIRQTLVLRAAVNCHGLPLLAELG